jgi:hypothetical protein
MDVRECLGKLGFVRAASVSIPPGETYYHRGTILEVHLPADGSPAEVNIAPGPDGESAHFPGCRTVGDVRTLLHLLDPGLHLPGDKRHDRSVHADADYRAEVIFWSRADYLPLAEG